MEMVRRQIERRDKKESDEIKYEYPVKIFINGIEFQGICDEDFEWNRKER